MTRAPEDLDFIAARVHARRSRIAEADGLDALCRLPTLEALGRAVPGAQGAPSAGDLQRRAVSGWLVELEALARDLRPRRAQLLEALTRRLRVEDQKLLVRGLAARLPLAALESRFLRPLEDPALASATRLADLALLLRARPPPSPPGAEGGPAAALRWPAPFLLETSLDHGYLQGLLVALARLGRRDRERLRALVRQEVDHFHLLLVARGHFTHGLDQAVLLPWHVEGAGISRSVLAAMLADATLARAARRAVGLALDALPPALASSPGALDALAWRRYLRLAALTFRGGGMGFGALVGYAALRRVEVANLVTLSEGIRLGLAAAAIRARLIAPGSEVARA